MLDANADHTLRSLSAYEEIAGLEIDEEDHHVEGGDGGVDVCNGLGHSRFVCGGVEEEREKAPWPGHH